MSIEQYEKGITSLRDTPFGYTLSMIGGKWRLIILYWLVEYDKIRFNELQRKIGTITYKTLSSQLKEMERVALSFEKNTRRYLQRWNTVFPLRENPCIL